MWLSLLSRQEESSMVISVSVSFGFYIVHGDMVTFLDVVFVVGFVATGAPLTLSFISIRTLDCFMARTHALQ